MPSQGAIAKSIRTFGHSCVYARERPKPHRGQELAMTKILTMPGTTGSRAVGRRPAYGGSHRISLCYSIIRG